MNIIRSIVFTITVSCRFCELELTIGVKVKIVRQKKNDISSNIRQESGPELM